MTTATPAPSPPAPTTLRAPWVVLLALSGLGAIPRLASFRYNIWPHGDVVLDSAIAESVAWAGRLLVPIVDVRYYPISRFGFGYPPDQHPPLWSLLGAALTPVLGDGYTALRVWSFVFGVLIIPLSYLAFRGVMGVGGALWLAGLCAGSFLLVDFSGNGSLWILLTALYLLFIWRAGAAPLTSPRNAALLGLIVGVAFLVNYPAVVLVPALGLTALIQNGRRVISPPVLIGLSVAGLVALLTVLPWFAFNASLHGNPIWSQPLQRQLGGGDKLVEIEVVNGDVIKVNRPEAASLEARLRTTASNLYGNVGFLARQMLSLAPVLNGFAVAGLLALALPLLGQRAFVLPDQRRTLAPIVAVLLCHGALALLWPTTKFRYLVPMLPLVLGLGAWCLCQIEPARLRALVGVVATAATLFHSVWTWAVIPSHTYYYNGGVVTDNFGQQGETIWVQDASRIARAAEVIRDRGPGTILGDHLFFSLARQPLVINSSGYSAEVLRALVERYEIRYVWLDQADLDRTLQAIGGTTIYEEGRFVLLELR